MRALERLCFDEAGELVVSKLILWVATAVLAGVFALSRILASFAAYDDEGYMLLSLRHYLTEGHLYTLTFSQYGPAYFLAQSLFFRLLHFPVNHDGGRVVTLIYWLVSSVVAGVFIARVTKSAL